MNQTETKKYKKHNLVIKDHGEWAEVDISTSAHPNATMKIDWVDLDFLRILGVKRIAANAGYSGAVYAKAMFNGRQRFVHRIITMFDDDDLVVDHINHDTLDNRGANLRRCTHSQNLMNRKPRVSSLGITGVYPICGGRYEAKIGVNGEVIRLGKFDYLEDAIAARSEAEDKYFGEYAYKGGAN